MVDRFSGDDGRGGVSVPDGMEAVPGSPAATISLSLSELSREGAGRLYYRIGMRYAPLDLRPEAAEYGFTVLRTYEGVDDPADVTQDKDGFWHMKAGARVRGTGVAKVAEGGRSMRRPH